MTYDTACIRGDREFTAVPIAQQPDYCPTSLSCYSSHRPSEKPELQIIVTLDLQKQPHFEKSLNQQVGVPNKNKLVSLSKPNPKGDPLRNNQCQTSKNILQQYSLDDCLATEPEIAICMFNYVTFLFI